MAIEIVDFPMKNGDFQVSELGLSENVGYIPNEIAI